MNFKLSPDYELKYDWQIPQFRNRGAPGRKLTQGKVELGIVSQAIVKPILDHI